MSLKNTLKGIAQVGKALDLWANYEEKVERAADAIREYLDDLPEFGIVLGSGLGELASKITDSKIIPYSDIPCFPKTTVTGHAGNMHIGKLSGVPVIGLQGRIHYYEGADLPFNAGVLRAIFPLDVLAQLAIPNYFVTNAAGGLNTTYNVGDIMILDSHINLPIPSPLLGRLPNLRRVDGDPIYEFQPMNAVYDPDLRKLLVDASSDFTGHVHIGTYMALTGRQYELKSESVMLRRIGVDAVGMSSTIEVLEAARRGMNVVGFSTITNKIGPDGTNATSHKEVKEILDSQEVKDRLSITVLRFFEFYNNKLQ